MIYELIRRYRGVFPIPDPDGRVHLIRWVLIEANRLAVAGALLSLVFVALMVVGTFWTFEMQRILVETQAVQTILTTLLSGIILLVSIVVSINSIILSHDLTSVETQENRFESVMGFRERVGSMTEDELNAINPSTFLEVMSKVILHRAEILQEIAVENDVEEELADQVATYLESIEERTTEMTAGPGESEGDFGVLWKGLEFDYGKFIDQLELFRRGPNTDTSDEFDEQLQDIIEAFEVFAIGKEYFKTLYYSQDISELSRTLLIVSLPAILVNATTVLAINAGVLPEMWIFGLPPLLAFVSATFTVSLAPYIILTAYMLRLSTVAKETATAGPFSLRH